MLIIYGYSTGCEACDKLKLLLSNHNMEYQFIEMEKGNHPFKTVPQTFFSNGTYAGNYSSWKNIFKK